MITGYLLYIRYLGMNKWYNEYIGFPYKHLGNSPVTGIDCFNLCRYIYKHQLNITVPLSTHDFCNIVDADWYNKTTEPLFEIAAAIKRTDFAWKKVTTPRLYDIITMSIGDTNVTNHCAVYVDNDRVLQTAANKKSWVGLYGNYYQQYTTGIYRWAPLNN
jgi:cell wall-associated NlpC family hydrolase